MQFGGTNSASLGAAILQTYPFTISTWVNLSNTTRSHVLVWVGRGTGAAWYGHYLAVEVTTGFAAAYTVTNTVFVGAVGNTNIADGNWHHVLGTYASATDRKVYVDGVLQGSNTTSSSPTTLTETRISGYNTNADNAAKLIGSLDDARFYNRVLSDAEIESLGMSRSRLTITDGLLAWWGLDEGSDGLNAVGASVLDRSGNGNTLTAANSPTWRASTGINYEE